MPLTVCPTCNNEVSTEAAACPQCGHPFVDESDKRDNESWFEAYIGANWNNHYRERVMGFQDRSRSVVSWNWAAAVVPFWFLYRKLYVWWFVLLLLQYVAMRTLGRALGVVSAAAGPASDLPMPAALVIVFGLFVLKGMFGDHLVYRRGRSIIDRALGSFADPDRAFWAVGVRGGTNLILALLPAVLVVLSIGLGYMAALAIPKLANTAEKAYAVGMRHDLSNLVAAQETYFADSGTYAQNLASYYTASGGVTITIANVTAEGWSARATHDRSSQVCTIAVGDVATPGLEGQPECQ